MKASEFFPYYGNYKYTKEHYELVKEMAELSLLDQYKQCLEFGIDQQNSDLYFEAVDYTILEETEQLITDKKVNIFHRMWTAFIRFFKRLFSFLKKSLSQKAEYKALRHVDRIMKYCIKTFNKSDFKPDDKLKELAINVVNEFMRIGINMCKPSEKPESDNNAKDKEVRVIESQSLEFNTPKSHFQAYDISKLIKSILDKVNYKYPNGFEKVTATLGALLTNNEIWTKPKKPDKDIPDGVNPTRLINFPNSKVFKLLSELGDNITFDESLYNRLKKAFDADIKFSNTYGININPSNTAEIDKMAKKIVDLGENIIKNKDSQEFASKELVDKFIKLTNTIRDCSWITAHRLNKCIKARNETMVLYKDENSLMMRFLGYAQDIADELNGYKNTDNSDKEDKKD